MLKAYQLAASESSLIPPANVYHKQITEVTSVVGVFCHRSCLFSVYTWCPFNGVNMLAHLPQAPLLNAP